MIPIINFMMQMERDPERAIRQAEIVAQSNVSQREFRKISRLPTLLTVLTALAAQLLGMGQGQHIEQKEVQCSGDRVL